ncbi:hypothetical protein BC828DRAFT_408828 [Blastocladiella britannica]|nr:hypothetical protein BC828DRAFT_408828 [Blastocladiella britannica]
MLHRTLSALGRRTITSAPSRCLSTRAFPYKFATISVTGRIVVPAAAPRPANAADRVLPAEAVAAMANLAAAAATPLNATSAESEFDLDNEDQLSERELAALDATAASGIDTDGNSAEPNLSWFVDPLPTDLTPLWMRKLSEGTAAAAPPAPGALVDGAHEPARGDDLVPHLGVVTTPAHLATLLEHAGCEDVRVLDVRGRCDVADTFVLSTAASSALLTRATGDVYAAIKRAMHAAGLTSRVAELVGVDGLDASEPDWAVLDIGRVFVHVFTPEGRVKYDLDRLWGVSEEEAMKDLEALVAENESSDLAYASSPSRAELKW